LGSRPNPHDSLSCKEPYYQPGILLLSAGGIEGKFEGKTSREFHQIYLELARQSPDTPGTCNPEETVLPALPMS